MVLKWRAMTGKRHPCSAVGVAAITAVDDSDRVSMCPDAVCVFTPASVSLSSSLPPLSG